MQSKKSRIDRDVLGEIIIVGTTVSANYLLNLCNTCFVPYRRWSPGLGVHHSPGHTVIVNAGGCDKLQEVFDLCEKFQVCMIQWAPEESRLLPDDPKFPIVTPKNGDIVALISLARSIPKVWQGMAPGIYTENDIDRLVWALDDPNPS